MIRIALAIACGALIAGAIHILVVLSIPLFVDQDAWTRIAKFGDEGGFVALPQAGPGKPLTPLNDPTMAQVACRFNQTGGYVTIQAELPDDFWSFALYTPTGETLFSLNDRTGDGNSLSLVVVSPRQLGKLRENPPSDLDASIVVETNQPRGIALLRAFVANPERLAEVKSVLSNASCVAGDPSGNNTTGSK